MFLAVLEYDTDAERKRIDYAMERWQSKIKIQKLKGTILLLDADNDTIDEFVEDLNSRIEKSEHKVNIYEMKQYQADIEKNVKRLSYKTEVNKKSLEKFLNYLMAKLGASFEFSSGFGKIYKIYTKKGQAKLEIILSDEKPEITIKINAEGYGEVVEFILKKIDIEMKMFLGSE